MRRALFVPTPALSWVVLCTTIAVLRAARAGFDGPLEAVPAVAAATAVGTVWFVAAGAASIALATRWTGADLPGFVLDPENRSPLTRAILALARPRRAHPDA